jgi:exonuclease SbcD
MLRFVHAADLHLDSPLRGLERYDGAPADRIRAASRAALENLVDLCIEERAAFLLIAGDVFDGDWRDYSTGLFFASRLSKLREAGVRVILARGNHDAASQITRHLELPENCVELGSDAPEAVELEDLGVTVFGQSFAAKVVTDDLASRYPERRDGAFSIGLLHTALTGRDGHAPYAPCRVETLIAKGYDYWALGHVHAREVVATDPHIVFPGNLQGRHVRETGEKGATLVTVENRRIVALEHRALDVVRWHKLVVDAGDAGDTDAVLERARGALEGARDSAGGRLVAARVVIGGSTGAHGEIGADPEGFENRLRMIANDLGDVWVERVRLETSAFLDYETLRQRDDALGLLARAIARARTDDAALLALSSGLDELRKQLPSELKTGDDALRLDDPVYLRAALDDVERFLLPLLLEGTEP